MSNKIKTLDDMARVFGALPEKKPPLKLQGALDKFPYLTAIGMRNPSEATRAYFWEERAELIRESKRIYLCATWLKKYIKPSRTLPEKAYFRMRSADRIYNDLLTKGKPKLSFGAFVAATVIAGFRVTNTGRGAYWLVSSWRELEKGLKKRQRAKDLEADARFHREVRKRERERARAQAKTISQHLKQNALAAQLKGES
jgi:hypothetical protein